MTWMDTHTPFFSIILRMAHVDKLGTDPVYLLQTLG